ncbi:aliphatic sulfonate ABC transporter substrate-binding protein [Streptomyces sp. NBC_01306]|uniref:aliphatic sulfonate ABC transporter substrate-binding protein n=1 Tax=Streptomyces sp. NBC_01306 TaxID=2903819 RepID=UPI00225020EF|nr:aliphatic sulfonate ABC transporter substrate-binding protein [Streptomyces sp. NBC_01306]MCX4728753.1 aliphatic sulfonate ABC transporter substrate-binding protein [Streptomyces sp. NBC_01306]
MKRSTNRTTKSTTKRNRAVGRRAAGLLTALLLVAAASGCGNDSSAASGHGNKVTFGYIADYSGSAALAVAQKQGLWKKAGLKPELKVFTNGPLQVQALGSGDLDFGYLGPGALWLPASGRAPIVSVNMLGLADRVIARPGSGITKPADLKGKKVAVAEGTSGDMILDLALRKAGLKPTDVKKVAMDASTVVTAFSSGQVDAAATWYPLIDTIKKKVPGLREISGTQDYYPGLTFPNVFVAQPRLASGNPALVRKVTGVLKQADDWIAGHPAQSESVAAGFLGLPAAQLKGSTDHVKILSSAELTKLSRNGTVDGWLDQLSDLFVQMKKLPKPEKAKDYYLGDLYASAGKADHR